MNKRYLASLLVGLFLTMGGVYAQKASQKDVTMNEMLDHLNDLARKGDDASKAELLKEADAMAKSKKEKFVSLAVRVYQTIDQQDKADALEKNISKRFPKGIKARSKAFEEIIKKEGLSATEFEKEYNAWIKKFPKDSYKENDRAFYTLSTGEIASRFALEGNMEKATSYISELEGDQGYVGVVYTVAKKMADAGKYSEALPILEKAYAATQQAVAGPREGNNRAYARFDKAIGELYGQALLKDNQVDKAVALLEKVAGEDPSASTVIGLSQGLVAQGKDLDAFILLNDFIVKNGKDDELLEAIKPLYGKLNNNKGDFSGYLTSLDVQLKEALVAKYKSEMVKEEAPDFELMDRDGNLVKLSDLKGKMVVLDFWATWCGPCVISFPGMQAAVNKYKNDDEVQFLFVNTWQKEPNYKEVVEKFITEKNYDFTVLFDEMKDRSKATVTAYGITGIPTKIFIDKEGYIRFRAVGGSSDVEKVVNEMETKIELMREG